MRHHITLIEGDGVGPEVTKAGRRVVEAAGVDVDWDFCAAGKKVFESGLPSGVPEETVKSIIKNKVVLKGPLETPVGHGGKSANVTLRKLFETYGNIRPAHSLPNVLTPYSDRHIDLVIIRENVEDLYTGIEHMQTPDVAQCLKVITRLGCEKIVRLAFEFAKAEGRKKVHCATKANIMKLSEGMLKRVFEEIAKEYPQIESHHIIVDNCAHQLVMQPEQFDVIVTTNLNGDILSDLASGLVGGLGFAPSANIGTAAAIFEAVHGSAPTIAGQNIVNPTSLILSAVMMLRYIGEFAAADRIEQGVYATLQEGIFTADVAGTKNPVTTEGFTDKVIENLGKKTPYWQARAYQPINLRKEFQKKEPVSYEDNGVDIIVREETTPASLGSSLRTLSEGTGFRLDGISNRGMQVYPEPLTLPDFVDAWQCRFQFEGKGEKMTSAHVCALLKQVGRKHDWAHIEKLCLIEGKEGYTKSQGEN
jgi:isocitrate dehydrogenase